jgi:heptosyltransferase II
MKILINALSGIGDALMFSPALRIFKDLMPDSEIDMHVMFKSVGELFENNPHIHEIMFSDFFNQPKSKSLKNVLSLRKRHYDYSINVYPSNRLEYNILNFLISAKKRLSHKYIKDNFLRMGFLNSDRIVEVKNSHNVIQNSEFVKIISKVSGFKIGPLEIYFSDAENRQNEEWLKENNFNNRIIAGFHSGSSTLKNHINKRWAKEKYIELGRKIIKDYSAVILLFGTETELNQEISKALGDNAVISSDKNFRNSLNKLRNCRFFVSNDTAFMHCSAALNVPTIAIFGYTNSKELFPWQVKHKIIRKELTCSPCFYNSPKAAHCIFQGDEEFKCLKTIGVDEVFEAVKELI